MKVPDKRRYKIAGYTPTHITFYGITSGKQFKVALPWFVKSIMERERKIGRREAQMEVMQAMEE